MVAEDAVEAVVEAEVKDEVEVVVVVAVVEDMEVATKALSYQDLGNK